MTGTHDGGQYDLVVIRTLILLVPPSRCLSPFLGETLAAHEFASSPGAAPFPSRTGRTVALRIVLIRDCQSVILDSADGGCRGVESPWFEEEEEEEE